VQAAGKVPIDVRMVSVAYLSITVHKLPGYSLEVFNAVGRTIAVLTLPDSLPEALRDDEVLSVRAWRTTAA
jgi:hypothetical protein